MTEAPATPHATTPSPPVQLAASWTPPAVRAAVVVRFGSTELWPNTATGVALVLELGKFAPTQRPGTRYVDLVCAASRAALVDVRSADGADAEAMRRQLEQSLRRHGPVCAVCQWVFP